MAKGARSSRQKENKTKLRGKIFGPQERARTERLSAKLLELANRPKLAQNTTSIEDNTVTASRTKSQEVGEAMKLPEDMEIDPDLSKASSLSKFSSRSRIRKRASHRKTSIVFPKSKSGRKSRKVNSKS